jgi:hypothetical protein
MKYLKQLVALSIWLACYLPTTVLVFIVMANVVLKRKTGGVHAPNPNIAR